MNTRQESRYRRTTIDNPSLPNWSRGCVYLFNTDAGWQKVGYSNSLALRLSNFQNLPFRVWYDHHIPTAYPMAEKWLHAALAPYHARGEWFRLPDDVVAVIKGIERIRGAADLPEAWRPDGDYPLREDPRPVPRRRLTGAESRRYLTLDPRLGVVSRETGKKVEW